MITKLAIMGLIMLAQSAEPPLMKLEADDIDTLSRALDRLAVSANGGAIDPSLAMRAREVAHSVDHSGQLNGRTTPIAGMALSRASDDPKACALLKRIEPSAVCMK